MRPAPIARICSRLVLFFAAALLLDPPVALATPTAIDAAIQETAGSARAAVDDAFGGIGAAMAPRAGDVATGTFIPLKEADCIAPHYASWNVGGQYLDPDNGVAQDRYAMLARWQGDDALAHWIAYDLGSFTGLRTPWQRGRRPEDPDGSPGAQLSCTSFGMLVNTWNTPHRPVVGGGYNDIYGYAWSEADRPRPFVDPWAGAPTHLVMQAKLAVTTFASWGNRSGAAEHNVGQLSFFAYLRDTTRPELAPIAVVAAIADSNWDRDFAATEYFIRGRVAYDYSEADTVAAAASHPAWFRPGQTGSGVWFASGPIHRDSSNDYVTTLYSEGQAQAGLPNRLQDPHSPLRFWRAHVTPQNLVNAIGTIESWPDCSAVGCPARGYSRDPADYALEYAGVLLELVIRFDTYDASPGDWIDNDPSKDQISMAVRGDGLSFYRYRP